MATVVRSLSSSSAQSGGKKGDVDVLWFVCSCEKREGSLSISVSTRVIEWKAAKGDAIRVCREDVLGVRQSDRWNVKAERSVFARFKARPVDAPRDTMVLSVIQRPSLKWLMKEYALVFPSEDECSSCCQEIESLPIDLSRPKRLLVFINPYSGDKKAVKVYESKAAPVFAAAGIRTDVTVTKRRNEAKDFVEDKTNDLSGYDGIIAVGGDGTYAEVVQGLMFRVNGGIRPGDDIPVMEMTLGQIPAGSGNATAYEGTGVDDPMTMALYIACGHRMKMDVATVFHGDELRCSTACVLTYGFVSDLVIESDRHRWLGKSRHTFVLLYAHLFGFRYYRGTLTFWPTSADSGHPFDGRDCTVGCSLCSKPALPGGAAPELETELAKGSFERQSDGSIKLQGAFTTISSAVHTVRLPDYPFGIAPNNHICNGTMDLTMIREVTRSERGTYLKEINDIHRLQHPFIQTFRVRKFTFEPEEGSTPSSWMTDGEPTSTSSISAYANRGVLRVFGKGFPPSQK